MLDLKKLIKNSEQIIHQLEKRKVEREDLLEILNLAKSRSQVMTTLQNLESDPPLNWSVGSFGDDIFKWQATLSGPEDTPYEGGVFFMDIMFPHDYPYRAPKCKFTTKNYNKIIKKYIYF